MAEMTQERLAAMARGREAARHCLNQCKTPDKALSDLDPARRTPVAQRLKEVPLRFRGTYLRAVSGRSMAAGIKAHCQECFGWEANGPATCTALACPLYAYRPGAE